MRNFSVLRRPGSGLLFQTLGFSTIGAGEFNGRVRDGIGFRLPANATRPAKDGIEASLRKANAQLSDQPEGLNRRCAGLSFLMDRQTKSATTPGRTHARMDISNESVQVDRAISTGKLNASPRLHTRPINVVVYHGSV